jgi:hypothetical protein
MKSLHFVCVFVILASAILSAKSNPTPFINQPLVPPIARPGSKGFTLTVNGTSFVLGAFVNWNGAHRPTSFISSSTLQATISAVDIAKPGTASVTVVNPGPGGGISNLIYFLIRRSLSTVALAQDRQVLESGSVATGDFNVDGKLDLAIGNGCTDNSCAGTVDVYLGNGDGTFRPPIRTVVAPGDGPASGGDLFVADFNADGKPDVAITVQSGDGYDPPYGYILLGNGDGTFSQGLGFFDFGAAAVGDLNGDGLPDLITTSTFVEDCAQTAVYLANADGSYTAGQSFNNMGDFGVSLGDFNGDGKLDLAINGEDDAFCGHVGTSVALGNGDGTFQTPVSYDPVYPASHIQAVDLNGDGKLDLVTDAICTLLGNGDGTFIQGGCTQAGGGGGYVTSMVIGDFNGDGKPDVALLYQPYGGSTTILVYPGNGDGTFGNAISYALPNTSGNYAGLSSGDFNGDGRFDVAVGGFNPNGVPTSAAVFLQTVATVSPTSLSFGDQQVGKKSQPQIVTFTNDKSSILKINGIRITGANRNAFTETNNCGSSLPGGSRCGIRVVFEPRTVGAKSALLLVSYEGAGGPQFVLLSGTGTR